MFTYRLALFFLAPVIGVFFWLRRRSGRETASGMGERLAQNQITVPDGRCIWLHGASLGELTAARSLIDAILKIDPQIFMVITMNSYTARKMVRQWNDPRIHAALAPLDYRTFIRRFLKTWSPVALISLENELWPNRMALCRQAGIAVLIVGGRVSSAAASFWAWAPRLAGRLMAGVTFLLPQDEASRARFVKFGLDGAKIGPLLNLKSTVTLRDPDPGDIKTLSAQFAHAYTILAASTHAGEDEIILDAFVMARRDIPDLRLILAPRHPERADRIASLIAARAVTFWRRSDTAPLQNAPDILLADTLGEMPLWYSLAFATFVGGTLLDKGGHTPFEPLQFRSAIIHGPDVANHQAIFSQLDSVAGALKITDAETLAGAILHTADPDRRAAMLLAADTVQNSFPGQPAGQAAVLEKLTEFLISPPN